jgi:methanogenic corrinoid protein MtbC1
MAGPTGPGAAVGDDETSGRSGAVTAREAARAGASPHPLRGANGIEQRLAGLAHAIDVEVIPRLILARRAALDAGASAPADASVAPDQEVGRLAALAIERSADEIAAYVAELRAGGASIETLYLELMAPAAQRLGELWTADLCDFAEVTIGMCRLQQVLHELSGTFRSEVDGPEHGRRVLLAPVPGEQHTFGLYMVAEFFRRAGWDVWGAPPGTGDDLVKLVRGEPFGVVGFSLGSDVRVDTLATTIRAVRRASCNRSIGVLVGGPVFVRRPELAPLVGADATALDARQAPAQADSLLTLLAART